MVYSVVLREPTLDASTVANYAAGQSTWHDNVREVTTWPMLNPYKTKAVRRMLKHLASHFKKSSKAMRPWTIDQLKRVYSHGFMPNRSGRHQQLCLMFQNLGMLRKNAARQLRLYYVIRNGKIEYLPKSSVQVVSPPNGKPRIHGKVKVDKNVDTSKQREFHIPHKVKALDLHPIELLESYIYDFRPPSGGFLLAAPLGAGFRTGAYTNFHSAYRKAYMRAFPDATDGACYGSGSPRKSLAQWLCASGWAKRIISDAGGWYCKKSAVDMYFKTDPEKILHALRNIGTSKGKNRR